jgi:hypothetical protein
VVGICHYQQLVKTAKRTINSFNRAGLDYYWSSWEYVTDEILCRHCCSVSNAAPRAALDAQAQR